MNVSRGLFRLWIITSALWISIIVVIHWNQLAMVFRGVPLGERQSASSLSREDFSCWRYHSRNRFKGPPVQADEPWEKDPVVPGYPTNNSEALSMCIKHKLWIPSLAIIPPMIMLIFGYAGIWVARGFRR